MKYKNEEYRAREAEARKGASTLIRLAGFEPVDELALLPPALREGIYIGAPHLLILPSGGDYPYRLESAAAEIRLNVLIVEPGVTTPGNPTFYFSLLRPAGGRMHWHRALRLWIDRDGAPFLVPDRFSETPQGPRFELLPNVLRLSEEPSSQSGRFDLGMRVADALMLAP